MRTRIPRLGDIILISLEPQLGIEITKTRPALVVSRTKLNEHSGLIWVCPITSTIRNYPSNVSLDASTKTHGEILVEQLRAVDFKARSWTFLEKAPLAIMQQVEQIIHAIVSVEDEQKYRDL